jgi:hypothetical protein
VTGATNGLRPIIFEIEWRLPPITDLLSTIRKPRLYEAVTIETDIDEYEGQVLGVEGLVTIDRLLKVTIAGPMEMDGQELKNVKLVDP